MVIWVLTGTYEGEQFCSTHLTEKGACLAAIGDVLEMLQIEEEFQARDVMDRNTPGLSDDTELIEWDLDKMKGMPRTELWDIFHGWSEFTWDMMDYRCEVLRTQVAP